MLGSPSPIEIGVYSEAGQGRPHNADSHHAALVTHDPDNPWKLDALLVVADGGEGQVEEEVASRVAVQTFVKALVSEDAAAAGYRRIGDKALELFVRGMMEHTNDALFEKGGGRQSAAMTVAVVRGNRYVIGHVGNCRAYLVRGERVRQLTQDQMWEATPETASAEPASPEAASAEPAPPAPNGTLLVQVLGSDSRVDIQLIAGTLREHDALLLCSDGLSEFVTHEHIRRAVVHAASVEQGCKQLVRAAKEKGSADNVTVVGLRVLRPLAASLSSNHRGQPSAAANFIEEALARLDPLVHDFPRSPKTRALLAIALLIIAGGFLLAVRAVRHQREEERTPVAPALPAPPATNVVTLRLNAAVEYQGIVLSVAERTVHLDFNYSQAQQQRERVFVGFRNWDNSRDALVQGKAQLVVTQGGNAPKHNLGTPDNYKDLFHSKPLSTVPVELEKSYLLYYQSGGGEKKRLCRFTVK